MAERVQIIGGYISPYVRKVLAALAVKGVPYEIDPIIPFFGDERFSRVSPIRRIPVLIDDQVTLCDSTVICEYLEERYPGPSLFPKGVAERARARWLEEFADTRMGEVFIWRLFNQVTIKPFIWGEETDRAVLDRTLSHDIPEVLDYLEKEVPAQGFLFGSDLTVADISLAVFVRNAAFARFKIDAARWPRSAAYVERVLAHDAFRELRRFEDRLVRTPPAEHRAVLLEMGAPVMRETCATETPRRGVMQT